MTSCGRASLRASLGLTAWLAVVSAAHAFCAEPSSEPYALDQRRHELIERASEKFFAGDFEAAATIWRELLVLDRQVFGPQSEDVAESLVTLVEFDWKRGDWAAARTACQEALTIYDQTVGPAHWRARYCRYYLTALDRFEAATDEDRWQLIDAELQAGSLWQKGRYEESLEFRERRLTLCLKMLGPDHPRSAEALWDLAANRLARGDDDGIEAQVRQVLRVTAATLGQKSLLYGQAIGTLAEYYNALSTPDDYSQAEKLYRQVVDLMREACGLQSVEYAVAYNNLGVFLDGYERFVEAADCYRQSLAAHRARRDPNIDDIQLTLSNLGRVLGYLTVQALDTDDIEGARRLAAESLAIRNDRYGDGHWDTANAREQARYIERVAALTAEQRAEMATARQRTAQAAKLLQGGQYNEGFLDAMAAMEIVERILGFDDPALIDCDNQLGCLLSSLGRDEEALPRFERAEQLTRTALGEYHPLLAVILGNRANSLRVLGQYDASKKWFLRALAILDHDSIGDPTDVALDLAGILSQTGELYLQLEDYDAAENHFRRQYEVLRPLQAIHRQEFVGALDGLARTLRMKNDYGHAEPLLQEALQIERALSDAPSFELAWQLNSLALLYDDNGRLDRAIPLYEEAVDVMRHLDQRETSHYASCADNLGHAYAVLGELALAEPLLVEALEIRRRVWGPTSFDYRTSLQRVGGLYQQTGDPRRALGYLLEAADIARQVDGEYSIEYAVRVKDVALLQQDLGQTAEANAGLRTAWQICQRIVTAGEEATLADRQRTALCLEILIDQFSLQGELDRARQAAELRAELMTALHGADQVAAIDARVRASQLAARCQLAPDRLEALREAQQLAAASAAASGTGHDLDALELARQALAINERMLGPDSTETLLALDNVATILGRLGRLSEALPLWERLIAAHEQIFGSRHPRLRDNLVGYGIVLRHSGRFTACEQAYQQALDITRHLVGERHSEYANGLNNLAVLYQDMGHLAAAENYARQAVDILAQLQGEESLDYANALLTLGSVFYSMDDTARTAEIFLRYHQIIALHHPPTHPDYLNSQYNLALIYQELGRYDETLLRLTEYRDALERLRGRDNAEYGTALNALGNLASMRGEYDEAVANHRAALEVRRRVLGPTSPRAVQSMSNLASCLVTVGRYGEAEALLVEALRLREEILPPGHPELGYTRMELASVYCATQRTPTALALVDATLNGDQQLLETAATFTGEDSLLAFLDSVGSRYHRLLAMTTTLPDDLAANDLALRWTLNRKAMVLDTLCKYRSSRRLFELQPDVAIEADRIRELRDQLAAEAVSPRAGLDGAQRAARRNELERRLAQAESALRRALARLGPTSTTSRPDVATVRARLPADAALIEYVRTPLYDFRATRDQIRYLPAHYFAFVITTDATAPAAMIDLGDAAEIDQLVAQLRTATTRARSELAIATEADVEQAFQEQAATLYGRVFAPLRARLGTAIRIYLALDGQLNLIPFAALVDAPGHYLIESYELATLSSGRDLLEVPATGGQGTLVFAGPDYDLSLADRAGNEIERATEDFNTVPLATRSLDADVRGLRWSPLAGAADEAHEVETALAGSNYGPVEVFLDDQAREEVFKAVDSPRLLHVATHGFFLAPRAPSTSGDAPDRGLRGLAGLRDSSNPLLRSGLVLAGANDLSDQVPGVEDGWVTAEEISQLDLSGTELVVLSACETGLGDVRGGEGVYGLRRALTFAGARSLVTSLYSVPDRETQKLMSDFYRHLAGGHSKSAALRNAQLERLADRRRQHGAAHPFFWASFIYVGQ